MASGNVLEWKIPELPIHFDYPLPQAQLQPQPQLQNQERQDDQLPFLFLESPFDTKAQFEIAREDSTVGTTIMSINPSRTILSRSALMAMQAAYLQEISSFSLGVHDQRSSEKDGRRERRGGPRNIKAVKRLFERPKILRKPRVRKDRHKTKLCK